MQTRACPEGQLQPVDTLLSPLQNPVQYLVHCLDTNAPIEGPLSPAMCRIGQQIVDTAVLSAAQKCTLPLVQ